MNIPYVTPLIRATIDGEVAATHIANIRQALLDAEWDEQANKIDGVFTGVPANNQTVTVGSKVYTFKTTLTGAADEIFIGATAAACADNLKRAINDEGTEGTHYGAGTTANADATATVSSGTITLSIAAGTTITLAEGLNNFTWLNAAVSTGYTLISRADHSCKYRVVVQLYTTSATQPRVRVMIEDRTRTPADQAWLVCQAGRVHMCIAHPYGFWVLEPGSNRYMHVEALFNPPEWGPKTVVSATKGATTNLEITAHGWSNGQTAILSQFSGDDNWLAQNGKAFSVTVVDANNITINLDSSTFADPVPGYAGNQNSANLSIIADGSVGSAALGSHFRRGISGCSGSPGVAAGFSWWAFNQHTVTVGNTGSQSGGQLSTWAPMTHTITQENNGSQVGISTGYLYVPVMVQHGIDAFVSVGKFVGVMHNAVAYLKNTPVENDLDQIPLDGKFFYNITESVAFIGNVGPAGNLFLQVPEAV